LSITQRRKSASEDPRQAKLLELPERTHGEKPIKELQHPTWTENKAKQIERYLILFIQINERQNVGNIMYCMVHATDHDEALQLMARAYNTAMKRKGKQYVMFQVEEVVGKGGPGASKRN
jgi:hypothetical protein